MSTEVKSRIRSHQTRQSCIQAAAGSRAVPEPRCSGACHQGNRKQNSCPNFGFIFKKNRTPSKSFFYCCFLWNLGPHFKELHLRGLPWHLLPSDKRCLHFTHKERKAQQSCALDWGAAARGGRATWECSLSDPEPVLTSAAARGPFAMKICPERQRVAGLKGSTQPTTRSTGWGAGRAWTQLCAFSPCDCGPVTSPPWAGFSPVKGTSNSMSLMRPLWGFRALTKEEENTLSAYHNPSINASCNYLLLMHIKHIQKVCLKGLNLYFKWNCSEHLNIRLIQMIEQ